MNNDTTRSIDVMMSETRSFPPSPDFARHANATAALYSEAADNPEAWWTRQALERLTWDVTPTVGLEWNAPFLQFFATTHLGATEASGDRDAHTVDIARRDHLTDRNDRFKLE